MKTTKYIIHISMVSALFFAACGNDKKEHSSDEHQEHSNIETVELTDEQFKTVGLETGLVEERTISKTIAASGMLDVPPQSKVSISAPVGGFVNTIGIIQGSRVEKGQILATLQHQDYIQLQQDYLENASRLEFLKTEYNRQQELSKENVSAKKSLEQAKADYFSTNAIVQGLKAKLELINIDIDNLAKGNMQKTINLRSPISGYVTKVNVNIGSFVSPSNVLIEIVNTEELHVELTIFEKDVPLLKENQRVLFTLANEHNQRIAFVKLIGREINMNRSVQVHCEIEEQDRELIPGMYLKALVETNNALVKALPEEAVVNYGGKDFIFYSDEHQHEEGTHTFIMQEITTGETELGYIEVNLPQDFNLKSKVVTKGAYSLLAKMKNTEEDEGGHGH